jgi:hypothetical protein
MEISYSKLGELACCETTYQITASACRKYGLLLSRAQFLGGQFTVALTCDGLIALARAGCDANLLLQKVSPSNGRAAARNLQ